MNSIANSSENTAAFQCRVCKSNLPADPLIQYSNMPGQAQNFPDQKSMSNDHGQQLQVFECASCGVVQLAVAPVSYYREVIRASAVSDEMSQFRRKQFSWLINTHRLEHGKILEVGCGYGEYLSILDEFDVHAYGIEFNAKAVSTCQEKGLAVTRDYLESQNQVLVNGPFDGFIFLSFLEHFPYPSSGLLSLCNNLKEGAVGIIEVPNFDMILKKKLFSEFISDHLLYFTRQSLSTTLSMNGFDVIDCQPVWHDYILSAVVRKRPKLILDDFKNEIDRIGAEFKSFLSDFDKEEVVIWGAGHQSLAMISILSLHENVCAVVDSAEFKQDRYTPGTHLSVRSPEYIRQPGVKAVIVMAASYSDEVAEIVKQNYDDNLRIAIFRETGLEIVKR